MASLAAQRIHAAHERVRAAVARDDAAEIKTALQSMRELVDAAKQAPTQQLTKKTSL